MQFKLGLQFRRGPVLADPCEQEDQRLNGGVIPLCVLRTQVISAGACRWERHEAAPGTHGPSHACSFPPAAVQQQDLERGRINPGGRRITRRVQNPELPAGFQELLPGRRFLVTKEMPPGGGHHTRDQVARAGGAERFARVREDVHTKPGVDGPEPAADAPPDQMQATPASRRSIRDHVSAHIGPGASRSGRPAIGRAGSPP